MLYAVHEAARPEYEHTHTHLHSDSSDRYDRDIVELNNSNNSITQNRTAEKYRVEQQGNVASSSREM